MTKKSLLSKPKAEVAEAFPSTDYKNENYQRKARQMVMRLREQTRRVKTEKSPQTEFSVFPSTNMEPLFYQARYGMLSSTRKQALEGLVVLDRFAETTWKALENALDDTESEVRIKASELLATYPPELPEPVLEKLIQKAWDSELTVRRVVAHTLSFHPDPRSIGPLMGLLGTPDDELREIVEDSLSCICTQLGPPPPRAQGHV